jgi:hypothetical protein
MRRTTKDQSFVGAERISNRASVKTRYTLL